MSVCSCIVLYRSLSWTQWSSLCIWPFLSLLQACDTGLTLTPYGPDAPSPLTTDGDIYLPFITLHACLGNTFYKDGLGMKILSWWPLYSTVDTCWSTPAWGLQTSRYPPHSSNHLFNLWSSGTRCWTYCIYSHIQIYRQLLPQGYRSIWATPINCNPAPPSLTHSSLAYSVCIYENTQFPGSVIWLCTQKLICIAKCSEFPLFHASITTVITIFIFHSYYIILQYSCTYYTFTYTMPLWFAPVEMNFNFYQFLSPYRWGGSSSAKNGNINFHCSIVPSADEEHVVKAPE